jgi:hypothetical protein
MTRILAFAGTKQAGKTTAANFIHGYQLRANNIISDFAILEDGRLTVSTVIRDSNGNESDGSGVFLDINRIDPEFAEWAGYNMWPYVKMYSFASVLKEIAANLFNLKREGIYGNNAQKNTNTHYRWEDMPGVVTDQNALKSTVIKKLIEDGTLIYHEPGKLTHREFLQWFGTGLCRKIYDDIWLENTMQRIALEQPLVAVIDDCRFVNEVEAIQKAGGKVIHLCRNPFKDNDESEKQMGRHRGFDWVIDNREMTIHDVNIEIMEALESWGWLGDENIPDPPKAENNTGIHTFKKG